MSLLLPFIFLAYLASAQEDKIEKCIPHQDLVEISQKFSQFKRFLKKDKTEYCLTDLGKNSFILADVLVVLKNVKLHRPSYSVKDDFGERALADDNWWAYLTAKVNRFDLNPVECHDVRGAYVREDIQGEIHLCPVFFKKAHDILGLVYRAALIMHERKHFDSGHEQHVSCASGPLGCDPSIKHKGPYAVQVQVLVDLAIHSNLTISFHDKNTILNSAFWFTKNVFQKPSNILLAESIYLQNKFGEVWRWRSNGQDPIKLVHKLKENGPMFVTSMGKLDIYPKGGEAYRLNPLSWQSVEKVGFFIKEYNETKEEIKEQLIHVNYFTNTLLLHSNLSVNCTFGKEDIFLYTETFPEKMKTLFYFEKGYRNLILSESGKVYEIKCPKNKNQKLILQLTHMTLPTDLKRFFSLNNKFFGLTDDGNLVQLRGSKNNFIIQKQIRFGLPDEQWTDLVALSTAQFIEEALSKAALNAVLVPER